MALLSCDVQKCLARNDVKQHHWDVTYVTMDYICVYALFLSFTFFTISDKNHIFEYNYDSVII